MSVLVPHVRGGQMAAVGEHANPDWMRSVQEKYDLGGTLDAKSTYAGRKK